MPVCSKGDRVLKKNMQPVVSKDWTYANTTTSSEIKVQMIENIFPFM